MKIKETFRKFKLSMGEMIRSQLGRFDAEKKYNVDAEIEYLHDSLAAVKSRLPPEGWRSSNFHFIEDPSYMMSIDTHNRVWIVWRNGQFVCEGPTLEECARKFHVEHHVR